MREKRDKREKQDCTILQLVDCYPFLVSLYSNEYIDSRRVFNVVAVLIKMIIFVFRKRVRTISI